MTVTGAKRVSKQWGKTRTDNHNRDGVARDGGRILLTVERIFEHPPAQVICKRRVYNPLSVANVVLLGPATNGIPGHGKLGTTAHTDLLGNLHLRQQFLEGPLVDLLRGERPLRLLALGQLVAPRPDLDGASEDQHAAEVRVAGGLDVVGVEALQGRDGVVVRVVVVPLEAPSVHEDGGVGEVVVGVNYVRQVHHGLVALVHLDRERAGGVVDVVDPVRPIREVRLHPARVLVLHARHDNLHGRLFGPRRLRALTRGDEGVTCPYRAEGEEPAHAEQEEEDGRHGGESDAAPECEGHSGLDSSTIEKTQDKRTQLTE